MPLALDHELFETGDGFALDGRDGQLRVLFTIRRNEAKRAFGTFPGGACLETLRAHSELIKKACRQAYEGPVSDTAIMLVIEITLEDIQRV